MLYSSSGGKLGGLSAVCLSLALAPAGCRLEVSSEGVGTDGSVSGGDVGSGADAAGPEADAAAAVPTEGLIAHFALDEAEGDSAVDEVGQLVGTLQNGAAWAPQAGRVSGAALFDGIDDYIEIPHTEGLELTSGTVAFWFLAKDVGTRQGLWSKDSQGFDAGGHLTFFIETDVGLSVRLQSSTASQRVDTPIVREAWTHAVFTFGPEGMKLYLNGGPPVTDPYAGGIAENKEPLVIGASSRLSGDQVATPTGLHFDGLIDEVRIYDRELSAEEVAELHAY